MINIKYMRSEAGLNNCFELQFPLKDYIEEHFFVQNEKGYAAELYYYIALFLKKGLFDGKRDHCHQMIWSYHYDCFCLDIPFSMDFDEEYDMVSFSVDKDNIMYRKRIAEYIKALVEEKMPLEMIEKERYMW